MPSILPGGMLPYLLFLERKCSSTQQLTLISDEIELTSGRGYNYTSREANVESQSLMTDVLIPLLTDLSPDSGAYLNEADWNQPDWQSTFYGDNYPLLHQIKQEFDPDGVFYARTAVGSEAWIELEDGHLCQFPDPWRD